MAQTHLGRQRERETNWLSQVISIGWQYAKLWIMPLGRQSAYRLQCVPANRTWHKRSHSSSWSHKLSHVLILSSFLSAHTPCHKGRKWAKDERKRSTLNTIYLPSPRSLSTPTSNPHVFNYNYAILIPKHALHDSLAGSPAMSRRSSDPSLP